MQTSVKLQEVFCCFWTRSRLADAAGRVPAVATVMALALCVADARLSLCFVRSAVTVGGQVATFVALEPFATLVVLLAHLLRLDTVHAHPFLYAKGIHYEQWLYILPCPATVIHVADSAE